MNWGEVKVKNGFIVLLSCGLWSGLSFGQGTLPSKPVSQAARSAAFRKNLKVDSIPRGAVELELKESIPSNTEIGRSEIFFRNVLNFDIDGRGHIYIPDGALCVVYELDASGRLISRYDKQGYGPGELRFPTSVQSHEKQVVVNDGGNVRVTFYDHDWKYIRSFKRFKPYSPFILGGDGLFYGASRQNDKLISVLDLEGKLLRSFGELAHESGAAILNSCELGISPEGTLWVGMSAQGKLIRFSRAGIIEAEVDISVMSSGFVRRLIKENLATPKKGNSGIYPVIKSIDFMGEDVLVMAGGLVQPIFRIGSNGALKGSYYIPPQEGLIFYDMHVLFNEGGEERFYLLRRDIDDDIRIGVYGRRSM